MGKVIEFKSIKNKLKSRRLSLTDFNIPINYVDAENLYNCIDEKYQNDEYVFFENKEELFYELNEAADKTDEKRVAWIVIDKDEDYIYIKELRKIYVAKKGVMGEDLKNRIDQFAIDYVIFLEKVKYGRYRKIVGW